MVQGRSSRVYALMLAAAVTIAVALPTVAEETGPPDGDFEVRGSVNQIHVIHADPGAQVTVRGPKGFKRVAETDHLGGLVIDDVPAGNGYTVKVEGQGNRAYPVKVLPADRHPDRSFYRRQHLPADGGYIETRDGTLLAYRVVLPDPEKFGPGPYDLVITYSGYQPSLDTADEWQDRPFEAFTAEGYAVAGVNMRGTACSGGAFDFMAPLTWLDGYDMIEAFAAQDWVDDVALGDQSWPGLTQLYVASTQPPSLAAATPSAVVADFYRDVLYPGGIWNSGFGTIWASGRDSENAYPTSRAEIAEAIASDPTCAANQGLRGQNHSLVGAINEHPFYDEYWQLRNAELLVGDIVAPSLQIASWQDPQVGGRAAMLPELVAPGTPYRFVGTNGFHSYYSGDVWEEILEFYDVYLRGDAADRAAYEAEDPVTILVEQDNAGKTRGRFTLPSMSAAGDGQRLFLGSDLASTEGSDATTLTYDPSAYAGLGDLAWDPTRQDRAVFQSEPLAEDVVMVGPGSADLWISADSTDVDLQVTVTELRSDGQAMLVQSGWLRASHRALDESQSTTLRPVQTHRKGDYQPLVPGEVTPVRVEMFPFGHVFRAGSRIQVSVEGPGGGGNFWPWDFGFLPGGFDVTVHHSSEHPSSVVLPVVEPEGFEVPDGLAACGSLAMLPCHPTG